MPAPETIDPRAHRVLAGASRVRVLEFLRAQDEPFTASGVAERLGLHPNTVRLHLDQLIEAGLVERRVEHRATPGRPRLLFAATASSAVEGGDTADGYQALAGVLAGQLARAQAPTDEAAAAGRAWARSLPEDLRGSSAPTLEQATGRLLHLMDRLGFAPSAAGPGAPIELHRCPFSDVAAAHPDVVCGVHLGLMEAVLEDLHAPVGAARLEPFAAPGICRAHLTTGPASLEPAGIAVPPPPPTSSERHFS